MSRSLAVALLLVATACAACGGATPSPSTPAVSPTATPIPLPTLPAAEVPTFAPRHADPILEALLPTSLAGITLTRESQRGTDLSRQSDALDTMLKALGKTLADFTVASAYSRSGDLKAQAGAWRVAGANSTRLMPEFIKAVQASSATPLTVSEVTMAGRTVTQIGAPGQLTQGPLYAFARDDIVLFVQSPDPKLAEQGLAEIK